MRTDLESGAWIEHRPIGDLKTKDKDAVDAAVKMTVPLTADGEVDMSQGLTFGGAMKTAARDAAWGRIITGWSFELPVPECDRYGVVTNADSIGELPIDDSNEMEDLFEPYIAKLRKKPNPKGATTSSSNGSSRAKASGSPKG